MKKLFTLLVLISAFFNAISQNVNINEASKAAESFFKSQNKHLSRCAKIVGDENNRLLYIFNAENAFVVIAGDKNIVPVLAYIDHQIYNETDTIAPFNMWIDNYISQIDYVKRSNITNAHNQDIWSQTLEGKPFRNDSEIEPLVFSRWDQTEFYNYYCPKDPAGTNGRAITGCVATALGQLIYYFRFPESGVGQYSYTHEQYGVQSVNYGEATYNYDAMCDVPTSINTEISKLIYHCGVGVDMVYGPNSSGMYNHSAAKVLRTYFKYSPETEYLFRDSTDVNWDSVIVSHLERKIPMYYAGWSVPNINGHGFICDGYKMVDSNYYFHFNFGWSGYMDGYFYTNSLYVGGSNFNLSQELIINGYPDTTQYEYPVPQSVTGEKTLTAMEGTFTDGSQTAENYAKNMDYTWHIVPETENLESISLKINYHIAAGDTLRITADNYSGHIITNDTGTFVLEVESPEITLHFTSDTVSENIGFRAHYTAKNIEFCGGIVIYNAPTGSFDDGSGEAHYNNFSYCRYRLMLTTYSAIIINIHNMDLEEGHDYLHFYKNTINEGNRVLSLTGHIDDTTVVFEASRMTVVFESDEAGTADGFNAEYFASHVGIDDFENGVSLYPNPANSVLSVAYPSPIERIETLTLDGRTIDITTCNSLNAKLDISDLSSGLYLVKIFTKDGVITKKFLKK